MEKDRQKKVVKELLARYGKTYAEEVGIELRNTPAPLFQLLVAATLFSARITAEKAVQGVKGLLAEGLTTVPKMCASSWDQRVQILNRHGYARYDESTARMLGQSAYYLENEYQGDLRKLREAAGRNVDREMELLQAFKGIGEVGAKIFLREVQGLWQEAYPFVDERAERGAESLGLPRSPKTLADLVGEPQEMTRLVAALVRVDLGSEKATEELLQLA